jgi:adenylate kinase
MIIVLLGPPGSGKGTQAQLLQSKYNVHKLSTGDMLRQAIENGTPLGEKVKPLLASGQLVPDELMIDIIKDELKENKNNKDFVFDGFPRTLNQAEKLDDLVAVLNLEIDHVFEFRVPDTSIIQRVLGRYSCSKCGAAYNRINNPSKQKDVCDFCSAKNSFIHREDDNEETVVKRLQTYHNLINPIIKHYLNKNILHTVDGTMTVENVLAQIISIINLKSNILT